MVLSNFGCSEVVTTIIAGLRGHKQLLSLMDVKELAIRDILLDSRIALSWLTYNSPIVMPHSSLEN